VNNNLWTLISPENSATTRCVLLMLFLLSRPANSFNVDVNSKVIHTAPPSRCEDGDCMFGFAVAQHREKGQPWLLVGAPTADSGQPDVIKGGAVFKCPPNAPGQCDLIPFDQKGNTLAPTGQQYDKKSGQWFGSLVQSSGENGVVLACAPRYVWYSRNFKRREPIGTCYTARNNFNEFFEYSPCRTRKWGYHRQGSCQAGLGAAIADDGNQVYVGAVGSWYWQGQVFSQKLLSLRDQHKTSEGSPSDDDSYLGYSVATGEFNGDGDNADVVVGMPRGANLTGKVVLYNANLTNLNNMTGDQIGAYFGYSVASCDLNGDQLDDVIVGAPMWTNYEIMGKYETGRVYVVYQDGNHSFKKFDTLDGKNNKARFGLSIACAGNINLDGITASNPKGIQDLVVGAPYDGPDHQGAIYIYLGTAEGIGKSHAQVIHASEVGSNLRTFGYSISAGMDLDNNQYPDILVGAYESNNAVFLKSAPVVHLDSRVEFLVPSKQVDLNDKSCKLQDGTRVPCVDVEVTLQYNGVGVPDTIDLELQYLLDSKKEQAKRVFFLKHEGESQRNQTITVTKGRKWRDSFKVHLPASGIHDKLTSIDVQVRYSLAEKNAGRNFYGRQRRELAPVLGHDDKMATDTMSIQKNCGNDNICVPNLMVQASHSDAFVYGGEDKIEISADIINNGEDAFNAMLYLQLPKEINYMSAESTTSGLSVLCEPPSMMNNRTLQCNVGNPLPANTQATVKINLQPAESTPADEEEPLYEYVFYLAANSSNPEHSENQADNQKFLHIPLSVTSEWKVTGKSEPATLEYNVSQLLPDKYIVEDQLGPEVIHIYDVKNKGPATIKEAVVFIMWPSFTQDDERHLLYLLGVSTEPNDQVTCQPIPNINPLYIKTRESAGYQEALRQVEEMDGELSFKKNYQSSWSSSSSSSSGYSTGPRYSSGSSRSSSKSSTYSQTSYGNQGSYYESGSSNIGTGQTTGSSSQTRVADGAEETKLIDESEVNTRKTSTSYNSQASSSNFGGTSSSSSGGGATSGWRLLENGTYIRIYDSQSTHGGSSGSASSTTLSSGSANLNGDRQNFNTILGAAQGPGDYHGTMKKSELEKEAGGRVFSSSNEETRNQVETTRYQGTFNRGSARVEPEYEDDYNYDYSDSRSNSASAAAGGGTRYEDGSYFEQDQKTTNAYESNGRTGYNEGSYFDQESNSGSYGSSSSSNSESSSSSSSGSYGSSSSSSSSSTSEASSGRWVWSDATGKWEWSESQTTASQDTSDANANANAGSSYDSGSSDSGWITFPNGTSLRTQSSWSSSSYSSQGSGSGLDNAGGKPQTSSGSSDSGWVRQEDGTMVRKQKNWSRTTSYDRSYGGVQLDPDDKDELAAHLALGEVHDNDPNDIDKPWADLDELKNKMDAKFEKQRPANIEPGFEMNSHRVKRQLPYGGAFDKELKCDPSSCTMIRCKIGPLEKNKGVVFRVRSRLFLQTLVEKYAQSVHISSKLVARITQLPYMADPMSISYQTQQVTTEVFPSEMGEGEIPWWVWLLAALLGIILLAIITLCLYKCGFFKRKRPDNSPEREPLNGYH